MCVTYTVWYVKSVPGPTVLSRGRKGQFKEKGKYGKNTPLSGPSPFAPMGGGETRLARETSWRNWERDSDGRCMS